VDVDTGLLEKESRWLNRGFIKRMKTGRPWVKVKIGATLDGRTATRSGESQWITCEAARADVQTQRSDSSAILTGIGTVMADNPRLNVRLEDAVRQPLRVVVDSQLRLPSDARIIGDDGLLLLFAAYEDIERQSALEAAGVEVMVAPDSDGRVDLGEVFRELAVRECNELIVESGHILSGRLLELGLVDELVVYYAASVLGNSARGMFDISGIESLADRIQFEYHDIKRIGSDIRAIAVRADSMEMLG
jgi:diaminohydroxyphosphoribosylaminopyrimidine deaminase/5-amino-6-(5-phosphoribosylamino)uracil reductase